MEKDVLLMLKEVWMIRNIVKFLVFSSRGGW